MRVISGSVRGRMLKALEGSETRPTTDKVKESIFNIIQFDIEGRRVLDLFSGSGQLAIEAVSRGAEYAVAVDKSKYAVEIIKENVKRCNFEDKIKIYKGDFTEVLSKGGKFDLIFLDPPYDSDLLLKSLNLIVSFDILSNDGIIICETDVSQSILEYSDLFNRKEYRYGRVKLTLMRNNKI